MSTEKLYSKEVTVKLESQIKKLEKALAEATTENTKLLALIERYELSRDDINKITDEEAICIEQIKLLKEQSAFRHFNKEDAQVLEILHRNLKLARGEIIEQNKSKKVRKLSTQELLESVK